MVRPPVCGDSAQQKYIEARSLTDLGQMTPDYSTHGWSVGRSVYVGSGPPSALVDLHAEGLRLANKHIHIYTSSPAPGQAISMPWGSVASDRYLSPAHCMIDL